MSYTDKTGIRIEEMQTDAFGCQPSVYNMLQDRMNGDRMIHYYPPQSSPMTQDKIEECEKYLKGECCAVRDTSRCE